MVNHALGVTCGRGLSPTQLWQNQQLQCATAGVSNSSSSVGWMNGVGLTPQARLGPWIPLSPMLDTVAIVPTPVSPGLHCMWCPLQPGWELPCNTCSRLARAGPMCGTVDPAMGFGSSMMRGVPDWPGQVPYTVQNPEWEPCAALILSPAHQASPVCAVCVIWVNLRPRASSRSQMMRYHWPDAICGLSLSPLCYSTH